MSFLDYFFKPVREGDGRIRIVLSFEDENILKVPAVEGTGWKQVDLKPFPGSEMEELTRDWVKARNPTRLEKAEPLIPLLKQSRSPKSLTNLWEEILKGEP